MGEYETLVEHFGKSNAARIYACAVIMQADKGLDSMAAAVRITIGYLKRIRRTGIDIISYSKAIELLELEQDEGRHYQATGTTAHVGEATAQVMIQVLVEQEATKYQDSEANSEAVREWLVKYWDSVSATKRKFLSVVVTDYMAGHEVSEADRKNISKRYAPKGIKPMVFVELLARYA